MGVWCMDGCVSMDVGDTASVNCVLVCKLYMGVVYGWVCVCANGSVTVSVNLG